MRDFCAMSMFLFHLVHPVLKCAPSTLPCGDLGFKDKVDFLEGLAGRLGVQEENPEGHDEAERPEDHVRLPLDVGEGRGNEECQREVEDPVAGRGNANAFGSVAQGKDL